MDWANKIYGPLFDLLACPKCKGGLCLKEEKNGLECRKCGLLYPVRDGIPVMLVEEASYSAPSEVIRIKKPESLVNE
ncbi:MAG: Trm112 family protein [Nitrospiraceae bacterium]|nr:Trm112 family protein [Nitrospiraceae bacterium]